MTTKIAISNMRLDAKLAHGDPLWGKFNGSFINAEIPATRLLDTIYTGHAITTQHSQQWRKAENYLCGQHLALDFDTGDKSSTMAHLMDEKFIERYATLIHTTMSHTPEHPRSRVVFLLDVAITQAKNYTLAATALLWLFGAADRQCKDAARFFYGSPDCEFEFLDNVLPLEIVKKLIINYQETGRTAKRRANRSAYHAPASQLEVSEALRKIPAWGIEYDQWVSVLMALHSQFGEDGYSLAEQWADGKPGEVEQKWRSFDANGNGAGAITIATVFGLAKEHGWNRYATVEREPDE